MAKGRSPTVSRERIKILYLIGFLSELHALGIDLMLRQQGS